MSEHEYTYHRHTDEHGQSTFYRIHLEQDTDAESPRSSCDNVTTMATWDSRYLSPDRDVADAHNLPTELLEDDNAARKLHLYIKLYRPDIRAAVPLVRDTYDGTLDVDTEGRYSHHDGIVYVTAKDWAAMMGDSPLEGGPWLLTSKGEPDPDNTEGLRTPSIQEVIEQDVKAYNSWATGEYVGYVVEQATKYTADDGDVTYIWGDPADDLGSCWGFDDEDYAKEQAVATLPDGTVTLSPDEHAELED